MNVLNAIGRVGRDAVVRYTQAGKAVLSFPLAVDDGWGDNKTTTWLDCSLWGDRGEKLAEHITKGSQLGVTGSIGTREHDGKTYVTLRLADVTLVGGKPQSGDAKSGAPQQRSQRPQRQAPQKATMDDFQDSEIPF